jgi:tRNA(adenine34) deaminase
MQAVAQREVPGMSDEYYMCQALLLAEQALADGEFPVGCVFVFEDRVIAKGARCGSTGVLTNEIDHAEMVALRHFYNLSPGCDPRKTVVYCTLEPCLMCFGALVIAGIGKIIYAYEDAMGGGTDCQLNYLPDLYKNNHPVVVPYLLREKSLALFQTFFNRTGSTYLKDSLLAEYTRRQKIETSGSVIGQVVEQRGF